MLTTAIITLCLLAANAQAAEPAAMPAAERGKEFWLAIAKNGYAPPAGESAAELSQSLSALLASPDPELRDEIAYTTFVQWIYQKRLLSGEELRPLMATLEENLRREVGSTGTDAVFRRSFSALTLAVVAARDNAAPFLEEREFRTLLQAALGYADAEKDLRGYDPKKGWIHATAHTADLLKFLGRSRYVTQQDQAAILAAMARKMRSADVVFTYGEDERLARAVMSIVARPDFDADGFRRWAASCKPVAPANALPPVAELRAQQNLKNLLAKLEVVLQSADSPHAKQASDIVQEMLKGAF